MTPLRPAELEFVRSERIGRLATISPSGWPQVVPVMYSIIADGSFEFDVDGAKLRNLAAEPRAALVVDAMGPKRGVSVQGRCSLLTPSRARLVPEHSFSWGI
ncbi:MAG TPA: pyridoxamine 5'-phosphate oxidase family protein [Candidatus Dormibacteraeota bacterium]